ncbi:glycoside hydrolase family 43 protein [Streptomyces sp. JH34]|uniref:glycoside hydrolase family 43 protein n=1 Tax=Streptomyces sp. JH34 TaxID=2793633 RepID=UPI003211E277
MRPPPSRRTLAPGPLALPGGTADRGPGHAEPDSDDARAVAAAAAALTVHGLDDVRGNLTLPASGAHGTAVTWSSSRPDAIGPTGVVHRPAEGSGPESVRLTATVGRGDAAAIRTFTASVREEPRKEPFTAYVMSYFTGEDTPDGEQIRMALSVGEDPLHWQELNGGRPVLTSDVGTGGLRDPFVIRSPEGDRFFQVATDLRMYGEAGGSWDQVQRTGSRSVLVRESTDLVHWTDRRLVEVAPATAGNAWAPEAYYDERLGSYVVFWASKIYPADDPEHTGSTYNRMMYATTRDFRTFGEPAVWHDPGYSVIDSTVLRHDGVHYRFTKDERTPSSDTPCSKFITVEKSGELTSSAYEFVADCVGRGTIERGEGPAVFASNTEAKWYLFIDEFGGRGYVPFESTDLDSGRWTASTGHALPKGARHGSVLPVTRGEYERLLETFAVG